jgi:PAS domain S-box-containing protein
MKSKIDLKSLEKLRKIEEMYMKKFSKTSQLEMYQKIVEHMSESIWIGDEKERTVYANPNFCKLLWYTLEEMIGKESYVFRDEESSKIVFSNNTLRKSGEASKYEGVLKAKDGTLIPVLCSGTPIPWGGTVWIMTDLREVKTLMQAKEELKALNTMKDEFISIVWHELRTPLTIIKGYLSMILEWDMGEIDENLHYPIMQSLQSTASLIWIVNDMLDLSKMESGKMLFNDEKINLLEHCINLYNDLKIIADQKEIHFEFIQKWDFKDLMITIDPNKLKQVIINIINNAFKFTHKWGTVRFELIEKAKSFCIAIQDTWIGMSQENLEKIFHKFHQIDSSLRRSNEWLGLGLSISQWIIHHYDSEIQVESEEWKGTKFYFELKKF